MSDVLISIIVPIYNSEYSLHRCIDSILRQTYESIELLLIDDGSVDLSGDICDEYAKKDSRIRVFHKNNGGVSSARNVGLDNAAGDYITFCDADDFLQTRFLESFASNSYLGEDSDLLIGGSIWLNEKGEKCVEEDDIPVGVYLPKDILPIYLYGKIFNVPWGKLFKSSVISKYGIRFKRDMRVAEDLCFVYKYLSHTNSIRSLIGLYSESCIVHYVPDNFALKYSMTTDEASRHFSLIWQTYKQLNIRCTTFENKMLSDVFELCKRDVYRNPSTWYENEAVKEAYNKRAELKSLFSRVKTFLFLNMKLYKFKYLWRKTPKYR